MSSGNAEIIAGCPIYKYFRTNYASKFWFDENGAPIWPAMTVNHTGKTQFLFRINKEALNVNDTVGVNQMITNKSDR